MMIRIHTVWPRRHPEAAEAEVLAAPNDSALATKLDLQVLKTDFEKALHRQTWGLVGVIFAQGAFIIAVLQVLS